MATKKKGAPKNYFGKCIEQTITASGKYPAINYESEEYQTIHRWLRRKKIILTYYLKDTLNLNEEKIKGYFREEHTQGASFFYRILYLHLQKGKIHISCHKDFCSKFLQYYLQPSAKQRYSFVSNINDHKNFYQLFLAVDTEEYALDEDTKKQVTDLIEQLQLLDSSDETLKRELSSVFCTFIKIFFPTEK